jgi:phage tail-like protein
MSNTSTPWSHVALPSFRFIVDVEEKRQAAFTECTLPVIKWETEELKEGGINTFTRLLPGRQQQATTTLKNGVGNRELLDWYLSALRGEFSRHMITISLLDVDQEENNPIAIWNIEEAFPMQWTFSDLGVGKNTIAIQSLQFACGRITVEVKD